MNLIDRLLAYLSDPSGKLRLEQDVRIYRSELRANRALEAAARGQLLVARFRATQAALARRGR